MDADELKNLIRQAASDGDLRIVLSLLKKLCVMRQEQGEHQRVKSILASINELTDLLNERQAKWN